jgi:hypothetical protein
LRLTYALGFGSLGKINHRVYGPCVSEARHPPFLSNPRDDSINVGHVAERKTRLAHARDEHPSQLFILHVLQAPLDISTLEHIWRHASTY